MQRLPALDGVRGIAILLVLAYHANWIGSGWIGVQWFFVLSGFLITRLLLGMERGQGRWRAWWHFVGRRALRIFPVYYAFLGAVLLAATLGLLPRGPVFEQAPWVASYTYNWLSAGADLERTRAFDHLWSLAIEEQFYLLWPLLVLGLSRRGLWIACGLLVAAGPLLRGIIAGWWPLLGWGESGAVAAAFATSSHLDAFALGALLNALRVNRRWRGRLPALSVAGLFALWAAGALLHGLDIEPRQRFGAWLTLGFPNAMADHDQYLWGYTAINAAGALLLLCALHAPPRWLAARWLAWIGTISYGIYLFHYPLAHAMAPWVYRIHDLTGLGYSACLALWTPLYLAVVFALSAASYHGFERVFLRRKDRWFPLVPVATREPSAS